MGKTHFGFEQVAPTEKAGRVRGVFDSVASRYDLMNDLMSGGLHRLWKRFTVQVAAVREGSQVLDLAGGTGDLARLFARACGAAERDAFAIVIEVAIKNGLLALLIITSMFPARMMAALDGPHAEMIVAARDGCIFVVLFFSGVGLVIGLLSALRWRKILAPQR